MGDTNVPLQTGHFVLELVKLPPPRGEVERPARRGAELGKTAKRGIFFSSSAIHTEKVFYQNSVYVYKKGCR